jgi:hypothetical protein
MSAERSWVPPEIDTGKANIARVYDYWLGGSNNFRADQDAARAFIAVEPRVREIVRANRAFLGRAVRFLAESGIRQFLDVGSGIPTRRNVHEVAQLAAPGSRVVYVDIDPVAVAHAQLLLDDNPDAAAIQGDLRRPDEILADPVTQLLIDFDRPVGVLLAAVLHFIPDSQEPWRIVATLRDALAPGSYLVLGHATSENRPDVANLETAYNRKVDAQGGARSRAGIARFFDGFDLVDPGLVWIPQWRPESPQDVPEDPERYLGLVGVGRLSGAQPAGGSAQAARGSASAGRALS